MTRLVRLAVVLAGGAGLLAAGVSGVAYSMSRLSHDAATAVEAPLLGLATCAERPSVIYAADGSVIATLRSSLNCQPVPLSNISPVLVNAVLDTEDHSFWLHGGLDLESTARALFADVSAGSAVQGGSTIAQQLVKGLYLSEKKTLSRKVREAVLAERLEQKYTKGQILDAYLNSVYLGNGAYGVQAAANEYFGVGADHVTIAQAALLAGLIQAPSGDDPITNPVGARARRAEVLSRMAYYKTISPAQAATADETPLPVRIREAPGISYTHYGYYVEEVVDELLRSPSSPLGTTRAERAAALFGGGLKIYTNELPELQAYSQHVAVTDIPPELKGVVAAFAVMDPRTGAVEALVGGRNSASSQFDSATQGERQPGSGFKLFTLIGALERYNVEDSIAAASPCAVVFPGVPYADGYNLSHMLHNDPGQPNGPVTLVRATADSINCAYLRLAHEVGLADIVAIAKSLGVTDATLNPENPSLVIGTESVRPIEMTAAYATVADGGIYHTPDFVKEIEGLSGAVIYRADMVGRRIFSDEVANEAIIALRATVQWGTGTAAAIAGQDVAGKTGTTSNSVDAWFNGISPTLACSVWIGNPSGEVPMYAGGAEVYGASFPTKIWHDIAAYVLRGAAQASFPPPDPAMVPPVKYIDSPGLARDDLLSHGGVIPSATTTTLRTTTTLPTVLATTPLPAVTVTPTVSLTPGDLVTPAVTVTAAKIAPSPSTSTSFPSAAAVPSAASSTDGVNGRP